MTKAADTLVPAIRIDGAKRIDLKARRARREQADKTDRKPSCPMTPSQRAKSRDAAKRRDEAENRRIAKLSDADGGKEGMVLSAVRMKLTNARSDKQIVRCMPGTFEWRYGRNEQSALYHAGSHFAQLWERAGIAVASSADFLRGTSSGYATTISDGRVVAMKKVSEATREVGRFSAERLIAYCVLGETASQLARKHGQADRDMAAVLHQDLRSIAMHFKFL
ncbi:MULTISPECIES: DUF6456 domain-containing protein [unclassified Mesorhizobium]|uniref:DUF6456 domain-containing protein n=1 Tax=unclassified Mesorhizobium TaxID=325217 RepID=UPI00112BE571|nr:MULTISPECIES: DUF6456 domain-containing protein [unclassified Mesorhizobium]TPK59049.1 hypothetical protein FJ551_25895 [Mesorhizobium sp. B2-5-1]TPL06670.1 hypothetical protein FJ944_22850 [Mesorhizobium sp. B2-4-11]